MTLDPNKLALESISSDLKRISMGLYLKSYTLVDRFAKEALARKSEVQVASLPLYIRKLLSELDSAVQDADQALMISTILQNFCIHNYSK